MGVVQAAPKETIKVTEHNSLQLTKNLLRIAIFHISYIRGLFPEDFFQDMHVHPLNNMKVKKLLPLDLESRRLIDWMEKGVYDALKKKYLKTMHFSLMDGESGPMIEEYTFSFEYSAASDDVFSMHVSKNGCQKRVLKTSSEAEVDHEHVRNSACKMMRTLIALMHTLDAVPDERTILVKLYYYDDITPVDYEPPFFRCCTFDEKIAWPRPPFQMKAGEVNSKYFAFALKVKSTLDSCGDEIDQNSNVLEDDPVTSDTSEFLSESSKSKDHDLLQDNIGNEPDVNNGYSIKNKSRSSCVEDDEVTQDLQHEASNLEDLKGWLQSRKKNTFHITDLMVDFPDISTQLIEDLLIRMVKEGLLTDIGNDNYEINHHTTREDYHETENAEHLTHLTGTPDNVKNEDTMYLKALYCALPLEYITITQLQEKLGNGINQSSTRKLIEKMANEGYIEGAATNRKLGRRVLHSERVRRKLLEVQQILSAGRLLSEGVKIIKSGDKFARERPSNDIGKEPQVTNLEKRCQTEQKTNPGGVPSRATERDGSTCGALRSFGSDLTRHGVANHTKSSDERASPARLKLNKRAMSRESHLKSNSPNDSPAFDIPSSQDKGLHRKASTVQDPIHQSGKRLRT